MNNKLDDKIDTFVRDFCKVGIVKPKSLIRKQLKQIAETAREETFNELENGNYTFCGCCNKLCKSEDVICGTCDDCI